MTTSGQVMKKCAFLFDDWIDSVKLWSRVHAFLSQPDKLQIAYWQYQYFRSEAKEITTAEDGMLETWNSITNN